MSDYPKACPFMSEKKSTLACLKSDCALWVVEFAGEGCAFAISVTSKNHKAALMEEVRRLQKKLDDAGKPFWKRWRKS